MSANCLMKQSAVLCNTATSPLPLCRAAACQSASQVKNRMPPPTPLGDPIHVFDRMIARWCKSVSSRRFKLGHLPFFPLFPNRKPKMCTTLTQCKFAPKTDHLVVLKNTAKIVYISPGTALKAYKTVYSPVK